MSFGRHVPVDTSHGCKTKIRSNKASYIWTIEDFHFHEAKGETLYSPAFSSTNSIDSLKWYLSLYPNGETDAKNFIGLYIHLSKRSGLIFIIEKIFAEVTFYSLNSKGKEDYVVPMDVTEFEYPNTDKTGWGFDEFIKKDAKFRNKLLSNNNALTIRCEVKYSNMKDITRSSHECDFDIEMPECDLSKNFALLFEKQTLTDVVLSVNGKEYPAHKAVLAARSPVFCAMFTHSTKENELGRVEIEDINEAVVEEMLKYIYTGKCENLDGLAEGLMAAADKYDLNRLKIMCAKKLFKVLSVENATNVLVLADMHHYEDLKREAIKFIVANFAQVFITKGWQNMLLSYPPLANEVCQAIARK
ncbi:speckle-type POZ protein B-like isoform X7 [Planococcus citri]|uniref:speckle-type POZ protein B-like isoform X7 n=1 Tax=Planococcus citri TaxID=170843 RepID=UPI0031F735CB